MYRVYVLNSWKGENFKYIFLSVYSRCIVIILKKKFK